VTDKATKEKFKEFGWNQPQFSQASHVLVFVARTDMFARIEDMMTQRSAGNAQARESLKEYEGMMIGAFKGQPEADIKVWAQKQAYIALGFAMAACAELSVESCPMEGFAPEKFNEVLSLKKGEYATVCLCVGVENSKLTKSPKFRFSDITR
jgi:nitroreductase / dihydropteridine reductase